MTPLHLFAGLRPQTGFPTPSADIRIAKIRYDLILPADISDLLLLHFIHSPASYDRVDRYCDPEGIAEIHAKPTLLDDEYDGSPTFAVSFNAAEEMEDDEDVMGYVALRLVVGPLAARRLYRRAYSRELIAPALADYVVKRDAYFRECGGFELLRLRYYFDAEDRYSVMLDVERDEPPSAVLKERAYRATRFTEFYRCGLARKH